MFNYLEDTNIPDKYKNLSGTTCPFCGAPILVNENYTTVKCANSYCPRKIAGSIDKITTDAGIRDIGPATSLKFVKEYGYTSVSDFLRRPPYEIRDLILKDMKKVKTLSEAVLYLKLPGMKEKLCRLTDGFSTIEEIYDLIDKVPGGIWEIFGELYGYGQDYKTMLENFISYSDELYSIDNIFSQLHEIKKEECEAKYHINIVISDPISSNLIRKQFSINPTKNEFVQILNKLFKDYSIMFHLQRNVTKETNYVINDSGNNTTNVKNGRNRGILLSSDNFIKLLVKSMEGKCSG